MKTKIRIGHPAYSGANRATLALSKAAAVRELRARGAKRDEARAAVNDVCTRLGGHKCITVDHNLIEVLHWSGIAGTTAFDTGSGLEYYAGKLASDKVGYQHALARYKGLAAFALLDPDRKDHWKRMGALYGYPECCITQFTTDCCAATKAAYPRAAWSKSGYVPCMKCVPRALEDFDKFVSEVIVPNRRSKLVFGPDA